MDPKYILSLLTTKAELNKYSFFEIPNPPDDVSLIGIVNCLKKLTGARSAKLNFITSINRQIAIDDGGKLKRPIFVKVHNSNEIDKMRHFLDVSAGVKLGDMHLRLLELSNDYKFIKAYLPMAESLLNENKLPQIVSAKIDSPAYSTLIPSDCMVEVLNQFMTDSNTAELVDDLLGISLRYSDSTLEVSEVNFSFSFEVNIIAVVQKLKLASFNSPEALAAKFFLVPDWILSTIKRGITEDEKLVNMVNAHVLKYDLLSNGRRISLVNHQ